MLRNHIWCCLRRSHYRDQSNSVKSVIFLILDKYNQSSQQKWASKLKYGNDYIPKYCNRKLPAVRTDHSPVELVLFIWILVFLPALRQFSFLFSDIIAKFDLAQLINVDLILSWVLQNWTHPIEEEFWPNACILRSINIFKCICHGSLLSCDLLLDQSLFQKHNLAVIPFP